MNIEFLKLMKPPYEGSKGRKKKIRTDEAIQIIIHIYVEISQGISLCWY
jgi:hypothetical protein